MSGVSVLDKGKYLLTADSLYYKEPKLVALYNLPDGRKGEVYKVGSNITDKDSLYLAKVEGSDDLLFDGLPSYNDLGLAVGAYRL